MLAVSQSIKISATIKVNQQQQQSKQSCKAHIFSALSDSTTALSLHSNYSNFICHAEKQQEKKQAGCLLSTLGADQLSP